MRTFACSIGLVLVSVSSAFAAAEQARCDTPFEAAFRNGAQLHLDIRAGHIEILGADKPAVEVECQVGEHERANEISITFDDTAKNGRLRIKGGPDRDVRLRIRVPRDSSLTVRCTAGDLDIIGVRGDKDVTLRAGDLTINVGDAAEYSLAEASVKAGDLHAAPFGVNKGGLFRSFKHENPAGRYRLRASLWAGDLKLQNSR